MTGFVILLALAMVISLSRSIEQVREISVIEGQAVKLLCETDQVFENFSFTWSKENKTIKTSSRFKTQGSSLWVLNTLLSDSGLYTCKRSNSTLSTAFAVLLSVVNGPCGTLVPVHVKFAIPGSNVNLSCTEEYVPTLGQRVQVQWWKECKPTELQGSDLDLFNVTVSSMANYTCMVTFHYEGKNYIASRTIELIVLKDGEKLKLECTVFIGSVKDATMETSVYWTVNRNFIEFYSELQNNLTIEHRKNNQIYGKSTLFISKVLPEFLGVPFLCIVLSPRGSDMGQVWLIQEENTKTSWIIALLIILAAALICALLVFCKIDMILCYRRLFVSNKTQQGKQYNSYVAYFLANGPSPSPAENLALKIFPEVLEQRHNLKLFIHGRDDSEGSITDMTDVLNQSRTVVLILSGSSQDESLIPLAEGRERLNEGTEFLNVIVQSGLPIILVESEKNVDYSLLPESIKSIQKKKGVLRWSQTIKYNDRLWKHLRYRMT